jgi:uncharacterized protein (DUF983 family)
MINKGTKLYSILYYKCPRCHEGNLFKSRTYDLKHFTEMPEQCECCKQRFSPEPSFYSGAMYVSYALQVALFTTVYVALRVLFNPGTDVYIYATIGAAVLLMPVTLRLSRSIYINLFIDFDKYCSSGNK